MQCYEVAIVEDVGVVPEMDSIEIYTGDLTREQAVTRVVAAHIADCPAKHVDNVAYHVAFRVALRGVRDNLSAESWSWATVTIHVQLGVS